MTILRTLVLSIACFYPCHAVTQELQPRFGGPALPRSLSTETLNSVEAVVVGKLTNANLVRIAKSAPPIFSYSLSISVEEVLSGKVKNGTKLHLSHGSVGWLDPVYPVGKRVLVAVKFRGGARAHAIAMATDEGLAIARAACQLPVGWSNQDGKLLSPWAKFGKNGWTEADDQPEDAKRCAATGRPTYMVGQGVKFSVNQFPPAKPNKLPHSERDGEYSLTLTNTTDKPISVAALRRVGKRILWDQCLVILCQGKTHTVPGSGGVAEKTAAVTLQPGKSVTHRVNVLALEGPRWPRDGSRIEFTFGIGEQSVTKSQAFVSKHNFKKR